jgi:hypothetical protein
MPFIQVHPIISDDIRKLCAHPYPGHVRGCPNLAHKAGCPPCPLLDTTLDLSKPIFAIYNIFDLKSHVDRMKQLHPNWTQRQLYCCLYWQPKARKQLRGEIRKFLSGRLERKLIAYISEYTPSKNSMKIINCPEAQGVNLTQTMKDVGINLEWPVVNKAFQIVLAGTKKVW